MYEEQWIESDFTFKDDHSYALSTNYPFSQLTLQLLYQIRIRNREINVVPVTFSAEHYNVSLQ